NLASEDNREANLDRAIALFQHVLAIDPNNPYAHFCLGLIFKAQNRLADAFHQFQTVTRLDPQAAYSWDYCCVTHAEGQDSAAAKECFEKAPRLNPNLNAARYAVAQHPFQRHEERTRALLAEHKGLRDANWETDLRMVYTEMGPYAEVIG